MTLSLLGFDLHAGSQTLLGYLGAALAYGTLLAVVTWFLLRTLLRRVPPSIQGALWLVVLCKFLLPVGPGWSLSMTSLTKSLSQTVWPDASPAPTATDAARAEPMLVPVTAVAGPITADSEAVEAQSSPWPVAPMLGGAYVLAVLATGSVRLARFVRLSRRCRALPLADADTHARLADVCRRLGVLRVPEVRIDHAPTGPFVFGCVRPCLILSRRLLLRPEELEAVLLHEVAHLRRGDLFTRYLQWCAGTLLFFWPIVAWVNRRIDLAREHACDDWALRCGQLSASEYARCLLRALQPASSDRLVHGPTAMAAHPHTVERRIEMILESPTRREPRSMRLPALALMLAWCGFVLTGASKPADPPAADGKQPAEEGQKKIVITVDDESDDPSKPHVIQIESKAGQPGTGHWITKTHRLELKGAGGEAHGLTMIMRSGLSDKELAEFATAHPSADADRNGKFTPTEYDAFIVAKVMSDPAAVLAQFKDADRNKNGALETAEAARLVHAGPSMPNFAFGTGAGNSNHMAVRARVRVSDKAAETTDASAGATAPRIAHTFNKRIAGKTGAFAFAGMTAPRPVAPWVMKNIAFEPTVSDVARYVPAIEEAPLALFLEMNPKADANADGKLTPEERDVFMKKEQEAIHADLLKHMPKADLNGDGVLTEEELRKFHEDASGDADIIINTDGDTGAAQRHISLKKIEAAKDGEAGEEQELVIEVEIDDGSSDQDGGE